MKKIPSHTLSSLISYICINNTNSLEDLEKYREDLNGMIFDINDEMKLYDGNIGGGMLEILEVKLKSLQRELQLVNEKIVQLSHEK